MNDSLSRVSKSPTTHEKNVITNASRPEHECIYMNHHVTSMNTCVRTFTRRNVTVTKHLSLHICVYVHIYTITNVYLFSLYTHTQVWGKYNAYSCAWVWVQQNKETQMNSYQGLYNPVILYVRIWVISHMCMIHCHMCERVMSHTWMRW